MSAADGLVRNEEVAGATPATLTISGRQADISWLHLSRKQDPASMFWRVAREHRLREALATLGGDFALQGEVHGEGIHGNHLGVKGVSFAAFNLFNIAKHVYLDHKTLEEFCRATGLPMVR